MTTMARRDAFQPILPATDPDEAHALARGDEVFHAFWWPVLVGIAEVRFGYGLMTAAGLVAVGCH